MSERDSSDFQAQEENSQNASSPDSQNMRRRKRRSNIDQNNYLVKSEEMNQQNSGNTQNPEIDANVDSPRRRRKKANNNIEEIQNDQSQKSNESDHSRRRKRSNITNNIEVNEEIQNNQNQKANESDNLRRRKRSNIPDNEQNNVETHADMQNNITQSSNDSENSRRRRRSHMQGINESTEEVQNNQNSPANESDHSHRRRTRHNNDETVEQPHQSTNTASTYSDQNVENQIDFNENKSDQSIQNSAPVNNNLNNKIDMLLFQNHEESIASEQHPLTENSIIHTIINQNQELVTNNNENSNQDPFSFVEVETVDDISHAQLEKISFQDSNLSFNFDSSASNVFEDSDLDSSFIRSSSRISPKGSHSTNRFLKRLMTNSLDSPNSDKIMPKILVEQWRKKPISQRNAINIAYKAEVLRNLYHSPIEEELHEDEESIRIRMNKYLFSCISQTSDIEESKQTASESAELPSPDKDVIVKKNHFEPRHTNPLLIFSLIVRFFFFIGYLLGICKE